MTIFDKSTLALNSTANGGNEEIVLDERAGFTPTDHIQQKLQGLMPASSMPVSCMHSGRQVRRYTV